MLRNIKLRLTGQQHAVLYNHLFSGDGNEAVALAICGVGKYCGEGAEQISVSIYKIIPVPYGDCLVRTEDKLKWKTNVLPDILKECIAKEQVILKIHSHPTGILNFSTIDDDSDRRLFSSIAGWLDTNFLGLSAIMLPDGKIIARSVDSIGDLQKVYSITKVDSDITFWYSNDEAIEETLPEHALRTIQAFGQGTTRLLSKLCIGVVGASGTGSPTIEMLYRLGVGKLIICDGDIVESKNVGRIYNSTMEDAQKSRFKVDVLADAIRNSGLPTEVIALPNDIMDANIVHQLSQCDILFGCVDSVDARDLLNRISVFYSIPYFDLGVKLEADGNGGVHQVCGSAHYLKPDGSSLLKRKVYTHESLLAASLRRTNPQEYNSQVKSKYIQGIQEDSPAVISVNTLIASLAVNDFLARIHQYRDDDNSEISVLRISLTQTRLFTEDNDEPCDFYSKYVGRGDCKPLLNMPYLD